MDSSFRWNDIKPGVGRSIKGNCRAGRKEKTYNNAAAPEKLLASLQFAEPGNWKTDKSSQ